MLTRSAWLGLGAILVLTVLIYLPSLDNQFTNWDDTSYVLENPFIQKLTAENLKNIITQPVVANHHPLTVFSLALNYQLSGAEPFSYHLVNLLLHLANTVLVFFFIYLISDRKLIAGLFVALFFAIHPMHVESVAWVAERKDVLYTFFFIPALISYIYFIQQKKKRYYWMALGLFLLSLLSKPAAVILPVILLLLDYLYARKLYMTRSGLGTDALRGQHSQTTSVSICRTRRALASPKLFDVGIQWNLLIEKIPFFALSLFFGVLTLSAQSHTINIIEEHSWLEKLLFAAYGLLMYLIKCFVPFKLSAFHPYPPDGQSYAAIYLLSPLVLMALAGLVYRFFRKEKLIIFGLLFFVVNLLLVLQILTVGNAIIAERYTYVPYIGLLLPMSLWADRIFLSKQGRRSVLQIAAGAGIVIMAGIFSYLSYQRVEVWQNSETLWTDAISKYPDNIPTAYNNRGLIYNSQNRKQEALADYSKAIEQKDDYHLPLINRGVIYMGQGKFDQALADINRGLAIAPDYAKGYMNRAGLYLQTQQFELALQDYNRCLELGLTLPRVYYLRGYSKQSLRRHQEALEDFNTAISMNDRNGNFFLYRSYTFNALGNRQQALADALQAQQLGLQVDQGYLNGLK